MSGGTSTKVGVLNDNTTTISNNTMNVANRDNMSYNIYKEVVETESIKRTLDNEKTRLNQKEIEINLLYDTHERNKHFKNSLAKRKNAYWRMYMILLGLAIIVFSLFIIRNNFEIVPTWLIDIILILTVSGVMIWVFMIYDNIIKRDLTDFDKLDPESPVMIRQEKIKKAEELKDSGKISASIAMKALPEDCYGETCCTSGTYYKNGKCLETFTNFRKLYD
jgi:hypothetical protein